MQTMKKDGALCASLHESDLAGLFPGAHPQEASNRAAARAAKPAYRNPRHNGHYVLFCGTHSAGSEHDRLVAGFLICRHGVPLKRDVFGIGVSNPVEGSLRAICAGMDALAHLPVNMSPDGGAPTGARIYTNSAVVEEGINRHYRAWCRRNWKTTSGKPVAHRDLYTMAHDLIAHSSTVVVAGRHTETWPEFIDLFARSG